MASATTAHVFSRSSLNFSSLRMSLRRPFNVLCIAITLCPTGTPTLRKTVESVRSRCRRLTGNFCAKNCKIAFAIPRLPSLFSKSIGFTLCGIALEPTSPALIFCLKYSIEMYIQKSRSRSMMMVLIRRMASNTLPKWS